MKEMNRNISRNIAAYMDALQLTQIELAERIGCSNTTVSMWITGESTPRMDKIDKMCEIFGCTRQDLVADEPVSKDMIIDGLVFESFKDSFAKLSADQRLRVLAFMNRLKDEQS